MRDPVASSTFDSRYNPITSDYDIALLTSTRPLWSGSRRQAIDGVDPIAPLPLEAEAGAGVRQSRTAAPAILRPLSGWGDVNPAPGQLASYPPICAGCTCRSMSESVCEEQYATIEQPITPRMICAGGGRSRVDTCYGDSGGPFGGGRRQSCATRPPTMCWPVSWTSATDVPSPAMPVSTPGSQIPRS